MAKSHDQPKRLLKCFYFFRGRGTPSRPQGSPGHAQRAYTVLGLIELGLAGCKAAHSISPAWSLKNYILEKCIWLNWIHFYMAFPFPCAFVMGQRSLSQRIGLVRLTAMITPHIALCRMENQSLLLILIPKINFQATDFLAHSNGGFLLYTRYSRMVLRTLNWLRASPLTCLLSPGSCFLVSSLDSLQCKWGRNRIRGFH